MHRHRIVKNNLTVCHCSNYRSLCKDLYNTQRALRVMKVLLVTIKNLFVFIFCGILDLKIRNFFKKLAHAYLVRQYFSKSFGGKITPI